MEKQCAGSIYVNRMENVFDRSKDMGYNLSRSLMADFICENIFREYGESP